jgi:hypothetical protein
MNGEQIGGIVRHLITTFGGVLIAKGYVDEGTLQAAAGAIAVLVGIGWSIFAKKKLK